MSGFLSQIVVDFETDLALMWLGYGPHMALMWHDMALMWPDMALIWPDMALMWP